MSGVVRSNCLVLVAPVNILRSDPKLWPRLILLGQPLWACLVSDSLVRWKPAGHVWMAEPLNDGTSFCPAEEYVAVLVWQRWRDSTPRWHCQSRLPPRKLWTADLLSILHISGRRVVRRVFLICTGHTQGRGSTSSRRGKSTFYDVIWVLLPAIA